MKIPISNHGFLAGAGALALVTGVFTTQFLSFGPSYISTATVGSTASSTPGEIKKIKHVEMPKEVKGVYMSQCAASSDTFRKEFLRMFEETELNTVVIDLKDYSGTVSFPSSTALEGAGCTVSDFEDFVSELHDNGVYVIGRLTVFQDPLYTSHNPDLAVHRKSATTTPWKDRKGLSFVDVGAKPFWQYIITLSKEAVMLGVDEINYDYIRYPSDGNMADVYYTHTRGTHAEQLERFFISLTDEMRKPMPDGYSPKLSLDLFGMTTTNEDDLNIGQQLERAMPYFDYIYPMVYPSHYPSGFHGYKNVNEHAYDIVNFSMDTAAKRAQATTTTIGSFAYTPIASTSPQLYKKPSYPADMMKPWLQSFDYPVTYTPQMVRDQIKATEDAGLSGWLFWDAGNHYYALLKTLKSASSSSE